MFTAPWTRLFSHAVLTPKITLLGDINPALDYLSKIVNQTWSPRDLPAELAA